MIIHNRVAWLCWPAFIYAAVTLWGIHTDLQPTLSHVGIGGVDGMGDWQQPITTQALFPNPITAQQWHFDFESTERILRKVPLSDSEELLFNTQLLTVLKRAVDTMPKNMNDQALQRAALLVSKGLPSVRGKQLADVFKNYYQLQQAYSNGVESIDDVKLTDKYSIFKALIKRQDHYLGGDVANQLFGKQRAITAYLYDRKAINQNSSLNRQQKQKKLHALQYQHKNTLKTNPHAGLFRG